MIMNQLFLAIKHDRHTDDKFIAFENEDFAINQCKKWIETYNQSRYQFEERDYGFIFYSDAGEDYSVRVELIDFIS